MVICLELGADLHTAQLMPLPLTVSCFSKIQIGFAFLVPAHLDSPGKRAVKWVLLLMYRPSRQRGYYPHSGPVLLGISRSCSNSGKHSLLNTNRVCVLYGRWCIGMYGGWAVSKLNRIPKSMTPFCLKQPNQVRR